MARYPLGQPVRISTTVRDVSGTLVDAGTLTLTVKLAAADGTWTTAGTYATPTHDSTGTYHQDIPAADLAAVGHYQYEWVSIGDGAGVSYSDFDVFDPYEQAVISLADAKDMLNIPQTSTGSDAELQSFIATIETSLEGLTGGPIVNRVITGERCEFTGWYTQLQVRQRPLVSVTSITSVQSGTVYDITAGLDINPAAAHHPQKGRLPVPRGLCGGPGHLRRRVGHRVPAALNLAARYILRNLWDSQRGASGPPMLGGTELVTAPGFGYAIPREAAQLLEGTLNGIPFADQVFAW